MATTRSLTSLVALLAIAFVVSSPAAADKSCVDRVTNGTVNWGGGTHWQQGSIDVVRRVDRRAECN